MQPKGAGTARLLLVNSNTDANITSMLADRVALIDALPFDITAITPSFGPAYVDSRVDVAIASHAVLKAIEEASQGGGAEFDVCMIACFGEPGLSAAREQFSFPIVGLAEAAMHMAAQISRKFALITKSSRWIPILDELADHYGVSRLYGGCHSPNVPSSTRATPSDDVACICDLAMQLIDTRAVDCIILGGVAYTGLSEKVQSRLPIPVLDSLTAAAWQAYALARLKPQKPMAGTYSASDKTSLAIFGSSDEPPRS